MLDSWFNYLFSLGGPPGSNVFVPLVFIAPFLGMFVVAALAILFVYRIILDDDEE